MDDDIEDKVDTAAADKKIKQSGQAIKVTKVRTITRNDLTPFFIIWLLLCKKCYFCHLLSDCMLCRKVRLSKLITIQTLFL